MHQNRHHYEFDSSLCHTRAFIYLFSKFVFFRITVYGIIMFNNGLAFIKQYFVRIRFANKCQRDVIVYYCLLST